MSVVTREIAQERPAVARDCQGMPGQHQAGDPPLGTGFKHRHFIGAKPQPHCFIKEGFCLRPGKLQVIGPDLKQFIVGSHARDLYLGILSSEHYQSGAWR